MSQYTLEWFVLPPVWVFVTYFHMFSSQLQVLENDGDLENFFNVYALCSIWRTLFKMFEVKLNSLNAIIKSCGVCVIYMGIHKRNVNVYSFTLQEIGVCVVQCEFSTQNLQSLSWTLGVLTSWRNFLRRDIWNSKQRKSKCTQFKCVRLAFMECNI
jgi:hypothetical protein